MSLEGIAAGVVTGAVVGIVSAITVHRSLKGYDENIRKEELNEAVRSAYNDGWHDASNHAGNVRQSYTRLYMTPDETEGTTAKSSKKG